MHFIFLVYFLFSFFTSWLAGWQACGAVRFSLVDFKIVVSPDA